MSDYSSDIVLVGGGHAHVAVLADWIRNGLPAPRAMLITPSRHLRYSGMVPGWIAGRYTRDEGTVDVAALARQARVKLVLDACVGIDPDGRSIKTQGGHAIGFEIASIDTGGIGRAQKVLGDDPRLIDVRPIDRFVDRLEGWRTDYADALARIVVIGGGAGGVELAFALRNLAGASPRPEVTLMTGAEGLLPDLSEPVRASVRRAMDQQGITVVEHDAGFEGGALIAGGRSLEPLDLAVAALGSGAPQWAADSGLATDSAGFIAVDRHQRSLSHPHIFAVGDVAARADRDIPHSGVHAVFAGPVLAANLRAVMAGAQPGRSYRPRWNNLYLMATGDGAAIASYGPLTAHGRWVARLKHWIDKRWIAKYAALAGGR